MTTSEETRMTRTPAPALSAAEAARVAVFDAAPTPDEVAVETVARAMFERPLGEGVRASWHEVSEGIRQSFRAEATAAIAAMPPSPAEEAVKRVEALTYASDDGTEYEHNGHGVGDGEPECPGCWVEGIRAALASPAPAPQGEDCNPYHSDVFTCSRCQVSR